MERRVFISSTTDDLLQYRQEAVKVMKELNEEEFKGRFLLVDRTMDTAGQSGERETPVDVSTGYVRDSDWIVLIVAWNYGTVQSGQELSVTEREYRYATEECVPPKSCFIFVAADRDDTNRYERKDPSREKKNLADWKEPPGERQDDWLAKQKKLNAFRRHLRQKEFELFSDIVDFRTRLKNTLRNRINRELTGLGDPLLALILDQKDPIRRCIDEMKLLARLKRVHDHLHRIRQLGICAWRKELLNRWQEGPSDARSQLAFLDVRIDVDLDLGALDGLKCDLGPELLPRLDRVLGYELPRSIASMDRKQFERSVDEFARCVQKAFAAANADMNRQIQSLSDEHVSLLQALRDAARSRALSREQDKDLNDGLKLVKNRLDDLRTVLCRHDRWQMIHNELEVVDASSQDRFPEVLKDFWIDHRDDIEKLLQEAGAAPLPMSPEYIAHNTGAMKDFISDECANSDERRANAYPPMREAFDRLFFELDSQTRGFVDQSEDRVRSYEQMLKELEDHARRRNAGSPRRTM